MKKNYQNQVVKLAKVKAFEFVTCYVVAKKNENLFQGLDRLPTLENSEVPMTLSLFSLS